jgi:hypothetical protein
LKNKALYLHDGKSMVRIKVFVPKPENIKLGQFTYNRPISLYSMNTPEKISIKRLLDIHKGIEKKKRKKKLM